MGIQIKKFQAPTLQGAIDKIREELGDNAIILQTEPLRGSMFGGNKIEVTAAVDRVETPTPRFHATVGGAEEEKGLSSVAKRAKSLFSFTGPKATEKKATPALPAPALPAPKTSAAPLADMTKAAEVPPSVGQIYAMKTFIEPLQREVENIKTKINGSQSTTKKRIKDPLEDEVAKLRRDLGQFITEKRFESMQLTPFCRQLVNYWTEKGMSMKQIASFFREMEKWGVEFSADEPVSSSVQAFSTLLEGSIQEANVFQKTSRRIVVIVGPTGVGKTTSLVKMAAYEKLQLHRSVALITIDDYKIGGTDQLAHYARILEVPFMKSRRDVSLEEQIKSLSADTIYIDTFGVSPRDNDRMEMLKKFIRFEDPDLAAKLEIHLALPVSIPAGDVDDALKSFSVLQPKYLIFTKWDETDNWGGMLSTILTSKKPVSFVTHGQNVPDDMSLFSKKSFIETITSNLRSED